MVHNHISGTYSVGVEWIPLGLQAKRALLVASSMEIYLEMICCRPHYLPCGVAVYMHVHACQTCKQSSRRAGGEDWRTWETGRVLKSFFTQSANDSSGFFSGRTVRMELHRPHPQLPLTTLKIMGIRTVASCSRRQAVGEWQLRQDLGINCLLSDIGSTAFVVMLIYLCSFKV